MPGCGQLDDNEEMVRQVGADHDADADLGHHRYHVDDGFADRHGTPCFCPSPGSPRSQTLFGNEYGETPFHVAERETEFRAGVPKRSLGTRSEEEREGSNDRSTSLTAPTPAMFPPRPSCEYPASRASSRTSGRTSS